MIISILQFLKTKQNFIALAVWVILFISCKQEKQSDILSHQEMTRAIMNVYITEQKVNDLKLSPDSAKTVFENLKLKIFKSGNIQDSTFKKSFDYYLERPKELELIYTAVVDSLNLLEQRLILNDTSKTEALKGDSTKTDSVKTDSIKTDTTKKLK